jgi:hypothetical protein
VRRQLALPLTVMYTLPIDLLYSPRARTYIGSVYKLILLWIHAFTHVVYYSLQYTLIKKGKVK